MLTLLILLSILRFCRRVRVRLAELCRAAWRRITFRAAGDAASGSAHDAPG